MFRLNDDANNRLQIYTLEIPTPNKQQKSLFILYNSFFAFHDGEPPPNIFARANESIISATCFICLKNCYMMTAMPCCGQGICKECFGCTDRCPYCRNDRASDFAEFVACGDHEFRQCIESVSANTASHITIYDICVDRFIILCYLLRKFYRAGINIYLHTEDKIDITKLLPRDAKITYARHEIVSNKKRRIRSAATKSHTQIGAYSTHLHSAQNDSLQNHSAQNNVTLSKPKEVHIEYLISRNRAILYQRIWSIDNKCIAPPDLQLSKWDVADIIIFRL
jgi:hypothetical protein